ncbi:MAG: hypothetical protein QXT53_06720 [Ignisphaera sp.]
MGAPGNKLGNCIKSVLNTLMPGFVYVVEVYARTSIDRVYESSVLRDILRRLCGSDEAASMIFSFIDRRVRESCFESP